MDLNRETAMRLWNKSFGKSLKVKDFTGRTIVKGAYNDRNSDYGWNVDHILPQSKGGVTADYNLICCHILTNDEKANKFPCFTANDIKYEIIKVENHYEIKEVTNKIKTEEDDSEVNFYDSASGVRFFKDLKGIQNKPRFMGTVFIKLENVKNTAVIDFVEKLFSEENVSFSLDETYWGATKVEIVAKNYNMPLRENTSELLDKCIVLNTYLTHYFRNMGFIDNYIIIFRVDYFKEKREMYKENNNLINYDYSNELTNSLHINHCVAENTEAKNNVDMNKFQYHEYLEYNYIYTKLSENLEKEVNKK